MQMLTNAVHYDWTTWVMGIMRSFVSGGGGAVAGFLGPAVTDSKDFNFTTSVGLKHALISMAVGFLIMGLTALGTFLKTHGAPDPVQETK